MNEAPLTEQVDHIGVDLYRAFAAFEREMFARLAAAGFADIRLADSEILVAIPEAGARVTEVAAARRVSKQAAQEGIQSLVSRGYLNVAPDPKDRRARKVTLSEKGQDLHRALNVIKQQLDQEIAEGLGLDTQASLRAALAKLPGILQTARDR